MSRHGVTPSFLVATYPTLHIIPGPSDGPGPSPSGPVQDRNFGLSALTVLHRAAFQCSGRPHRPVGRRGEGHDVGSRPRGQPPTALRGWLEPPATSTGCQAHERLSCTLTVVRVQRVALK